MILIAVFSWVHGQSELQVSTYHAERFDQPEQATAWLQMFRSINSKFLTEVKLRSLNQKQGRTLREQQENFVPAPIYIYIHFYLESFQKEEF